MKHLVLPIVLTLVVAFATLAQPSAYVGLVSQKSIGSYWENGLGASYTVKAWTHGRLFVGAEYLSSRYGSAWASNALKQDYYNAFASFMFLEGKKVRPFTKLNLGFFRVSYESPLFEALPNQAILVSPEIGVSYAPCRAAMISAGLGYNLIHGNGINDQPGTLYPMVLKFGLYYNILSLDDKLNK